MGYLEDLRVREHARKLSRTWAAAAAGQSGLPTQMMPVRQGGGVQPLILAGTGRSDPLAGGFGETVTLVKAGMTAVGTVSWDSRVRGEGFAVELPNPVAGYFGYYDFHVGVVSNGGVLDGLTVSVDGGETVALEPVPFCSEWRGVVPHVICSPGDVLTVVLAWTGSADVDVELTVGLVEPLAAQTPPDLPQFRPTLTGDSDAGLSGRILEHGVPAETEVGDLLIVSWCGQSLTGAQGGAGSMIPNTEWTQVAGWDALGNGFDDRRQSYVYVKTADAADAANTSTYEWEHTGNTYASIACVALANGAALTLSAPAISATVAGVSSLSVTAPAGDLAIVVGTHRRYSTGDPTTLVALDEPTETVGFYNPIPADTRRGVHVFGVSTVGGTVTAQLTGSTTQSPKFLAAIGAS